MKDDRTVLSSIRTTIEKMDEKPRILGDDHLDEIAGMYSQGELEQMVESGVISGNWKSTQRADGAVKMRNKMTKAELVAEAESLGVKVVPDEMTNKQIIEAIEAAGE